MITIYQNSPSILLEWIYEWDLYRGLKNMRNNKRQNWDEKEKEERLRREKNRRKD